MINLFRKKEDKFSYIEKGEGTPIILLHGLMGALSNFESTIDFFSKKYKVVAPELPIYDLPLLSSTVKSLTNWLARSALYQASSEKGESTHPYWKFWVVRKCYGG